MKLFSNQRKEKAVKAKINLKWIWKLKWKNYRELIELNLMMFGRRNKLLIKIKRQKELQKQTELSKLISHNKINSQ